VKNLIQNIDLESLRFGSSRLPAAKLNSKPPRHRPGEKFLKGPVPLNWLATAGRLSGKALHVGVELWFQAGLTQSRRIKLSMAHLAKYGVTRHSAYRALKQLEVAHLISVERQQGRLSIVVLIDIAMDDENEVALIPADGEK
jgi:hypothetical protein